MSGEDHPCSECGAPAVTEYDYGPKFYRCAEHDSVREDGFFGGVRPLNGAWERTARYPASAIRPGQLLRARFQPLRTDDLKPEAAWWIGRESTWRAAWIIDRGYAYAGQWAFFPSPEDDLAAGENAIGWVPGCDLLVLIDRKPPETTP